jgi:CHAT domain-containing protein
MTQSRSENAFRRPFRGLVPLLGMIVFVATAIVLVVAIVRSYSNKTERVVVILPPRRTIQGRVTTFEHRPLRIVRSANLDVSLGMRRMLADAHEVAVRDRSVENLHRLARIYMAMGNAKSAYPLLEEIHRVSPRDAAVLSDLAADEIALGRIFDAIEHAADALALDPRSETSAFNVALALEKASNRVETIQAWRSYLKLDAASAWAAEARQHLQTLQASRGAWETDREQLKPSADLATIARLVRQYPQRSRARTHNILLPAWVDRGNEEDLALIRAIARERAQAGDPFLTDVVENAVRRRGEVAPAFRAFTAARAADPIDPDTAGRLFSEAAEIFERAGSPLATAAKIYAASDEFYGGRLQSGLDRYDDVLRRLGDGGNVYPGIVAEALWGKALVLSQMGEPRRCLETYRLALTQAKRAGEIETEAYIRALIASQLELIGEPTEAEQYRLASLQQLDEINGHPNPVYVAFADTASSALRSGRPRVALLFAKAQAQVGARVDHPLLLAESRAQLAFVFMELGDANEAIRQVKSAQEYANRITALALRDRTLSTIDYIRGRIGVAMHDRDMAIEGFSAAIDLWKRYGWRMHLANGYLARGEASLETGNDQSAERDFLAGIVEIENQRAELAPEPALSVAYFERADRVFDRLLLLMLDQDRAEDALSIVERKRARLLLDQVNDSSPAGAGRTLDARGILAMTEARTAVVEIAFAGDACAVWLIYAGRITHWRSDTTRRAVEAAAKRYLAAIANHDQLGNRREGRWLYDALLGPQVSALPAETTLIVIPDGELNAIPFASLLTPNLHYLVERHPLIIASSASVYFSAQSWHGDDTLLAVAQPAPEGFDRLDGAAVEVRSIARAYQRSAVFIGEEIDSRAFLTLTGDAGVVHFAGHASTDFDRPSRSALIFESRTTGFEALPADSIAAADLRAHPLIVLAACNTGSGKLRRNEGVDSIANAFLRAGARGVVATLWDIEDGEAVQLFRSFHQHLSLGIGAADALRQAQVELIRSEQERDREPAAWSGAIVIGTRREENKK